MTVSARGAFRPLPGSGARGVVRQLLLVDFARSVLRVVGKVLLGYRSVGTATVAGDRVEVTRNETLFGRPFRSRQLALTASAIETIGLTTLAPGGVRPVGVAALALGTAVGSGLLTVALRTPGRPPSLALLGLSCVVAGVLIDFWLDGRPRKGRVHLVLRSADSSFALSGVDEAAARGFVAALGLSPPRAPEAETEHLASAAAVSEGDAERPSAPSSAP